MGARGDASRPRIVPHSAAYYGTCALGGALSCGGTHLLVTPVDLVKCRRQVLPGGGGLRAVWADGGLRGLYTGGVPTALGYAAQGACKFGFYEYFKRAYAAAAGPERAHTHRTLLYLGASASAEAIADAALCPFEALKVRMQTGGARAPRHFFSGMASMVQKDGLSGIYRGLPALWARQIPYTMVKFAAFERAVEAIYARVLRRPKEALSAFGQLGVSLAGGYAAGVLCALVSHPADTLVSRYYAGASSGALFSLAGLWRGLGPRVGMVGTLTALQWLAYDTFKVYSGLPTTGG